MAESILLLMRPATATSTPSSSVGDRSVQTFARLPSSSNEAMWLVDMQPFSPVQLETSESRIFFAPPVRVSSFMMEVSLIELT